MNWKDAFEETQPGGTTAKTLTPEEFSAALRGLDEANRGLERGDARYQEACRTGVLAWWDELGRCVVIRRESAPSDGRRAIAGNPVEDLPVIVEPLDNDLTRAALRQPVGDPAPVDAEVEETVPSHGITYANPDAQPPASHPLAGTTPPGSPPTPAREPPNMRPTYSNKPKPKKGKR